MLSIAPIHVGLHHLAGGCEEMVGMTPPWVL